MTLLIDYYTYLIYVSNCVILILHYKQHRTSRIICFTRKEAGPFLFCSRNRTTFNEWSSRARHKWVRKGIFRWIGHCYLYILFFFVAFVFFVYRCLRVETFRQSSQWPFFVFYFFVYLLRSPYNTVNKSIQIVPITKRMHNRMTIYRLKLIYNILLVYP